MTTNILIKKQLSIKAQTFATIISVIAAVALPHIFHIIGAVSGLNTGLGEAFLPMHLPEPFASHTMTEFKEEAHEFITCR